MRILIFLLLSLPLMSFANYNSVTCTIHNFNLQLSDFGLSKDYKPSHKRNIGNHNSALTFNFINEILIKEQTYSLEGQLFDIAFNKKSLKLNTILIANNHPELKPLVFDSVLLDCRSNKKNLYCKTTLENNFLARLHIHFNSPSKGTIRAFANRNKGSILTKHKFSCRQAPFI